MQSSEINHLKFVDTSKLVPMVVCNQSEGTHKLDYVWLRKARKGEKPSYHLEAKDNGTETT